MKKSLKKVLCVFLAVMVLVSSIPVEMVYALGDIQDYAEAMDEMDNIMDEMDLPSMDEQLEDFIIESEKYFGKTSEQLENITKNLKSVSSIMTTFQYVSYATSAVNNILSILKMLGVMEDANQSTLNSILDAVKSIKADVEEINKKVSSIQRDLASNFADQSYQNDQIKAQNYQAFWTDFIRNEYAEMMSYVNAYEGQINQNAISWLETWKGDNKTDLRSLYNQKGLLLYSGANLNGYNKALPVTPSISDDTKNKNLDTIISHEIVLPAKYLTLSTKTVVNADNYVEIFNSVIKNGVKQAVDDGVIKIDKDSLSFWNIDDTTTQDDIINKITEDLVNSIFYEITSIIANTTSDNNVSFAQNVLDAFQAFCDAIKGENGTSSSIEMAYDALALTYAFEGEAKHSAMGYYSLVGMSIMQFGTLTSTLVAATPSIKSTTKTNLGNLIYNTMKKNNDTYKGFITGKDNYCYPLRGLLNYVDISVQTLSQSDTKYEYEGCTGGRCEWSVKSDSFSDWLVVDASKKFNTDNLDVYKLEAQKNQNILKTTMLDSQNLNYLYHYFQVSSANQSIMDYLKNNGVISTDGNHNPILITSNFSIKDQPLDNTILISAPFASDFKKIDKYNDDSILSGYEKDNSVSIIKKDNYKTPIHTKIVGDTFSLSGMPTSSTAKGEAESRASYEVTLGTRVFQYYDGAFASPRYILHDDAEVSLEISESATDRSEFYLAKPYRSIYTAKVEKKYGALVLNYDVNSDVTNYQLTINNKTEFTNFIKSIASGNDYSGKNIILKSDIDLAGVNLENYWPSSLYTKVFKGHFNGNGKTISNLTLKSNGNRVALFRTTGEDTLIENLKLENVNISNTDNKKGYAALVGYADGRLIVDNVEIVSGDITGYKYVAGIVGEARENTKVHILNSINNANITSRDTDAGGIIGNTGNYYIYNCINRGNITANRGAAGGMSGYSGSDSKKDSSFVRNSKNFGIITGYDCAGGMSGHIQSDNRFSRFFGNENHGNVLVTYHGSAGGIVGYTEAGGSFIDNKNFANIETKDKSAGGIVGENEDDPILLRNNENSGNVKGINKTGGIAGYLGDRDYDSIVILEDNSNSGIIEATSKDTGDAGGIAGSIYTDNKNHIIKNNDNTGAVTAARQAGGIVGYMAGGGYFDSNSNKATIISTTQNAGGIVGKIQDDKCDFRNSNIYNPRINIGDNLSVTNEKFDYLIKVSSSSMRAAKICGWDDYKDASINNDSLVATIFGEGNIIVISLMLILLIIIAVVSILLNKKETRKTKKVTKYSQSRRK